MKKGIGFCVLMVSVFALVWFSMPLSFGQVRLGLPGNAVSSIAEKRKSVVVIQAGRERMTNAVRCMSYVLDVADNLPEERAGSRSHLAALAGVLFFNDCLMAKMSHVQISITTNELRQSFSNAVAQMFTNNVPAELASEISRPSLKNNISATSIQSLQERDKLLDEHPYLALAHGFESSFEDRNNIHISVDDQYRRIKNIPALAATLDALESTFRQSGVTDSYQSDLKETCLMTGSLRTDASLIYGPQSDSPRPAEYQAIAESLDKVLRWRLVNMYGLDDSVAQSLVHAVSQIPVIGFSHAGLQVPAFIR